MEVKAQQSTLLFSIPPLFEKFAKSISSKGAPRVYQISCQGGANRFH